MKLSKISELILDNMTEQVYVRDLDMNILYINASASKLTGWPLEEVVGRKCYEIFGDKNLTCRDICPVNRAISANQHIRHHEGDLQTQNGNVHVMKVSISPFSENGKVMGAVVVMDDITQLREIEKTNIKNLIALEQVNQELQESEDKYRKLSDAAFEGIVISEKGKLLEVNHAAADILGYSTDELTSMPILNLVPQEVQEEVQAKISSGYEKPYKTLVLTKGGKRLSVEVRGKMFHYKGRQVRVTAIRDLTPQKEIEAALHKSETKFKAIFEQASVGVALVEPSTNKFTEINRKFCEIAGYLKEELTQLAFIDVTYPDDQPEQLKKIQQLLEGQISAFSMEIRYKKPDNSTAWVNLSVSTMRDAAKRPSMYIAVIQDISERKSMETEIKILSGFLPICASCKKIRDDKGYWNQIETYIRNHSEAEFSHSVCPECIKALYPDLDLKE